MTVEERLAAWAKQDPTCVTGTEEWDFIRAMREAAQRGVGYGWMQQVIEWEWNATVDGGGWGPEFHGRLIAALEAKNATLVAACETMRKWLLREGGWTQALEENGINAALASVTPPKGG